MRRRLLRALLLPGLVLGLILGLSLVLLLLAVETAPLVRDAGPPDARAAAQARDLVDRLRHRATAHGKPVQLTRSEFRLLDTLIRQPGRVFSRSELIDAALGGDSLVLERTIDVHIRSLRKKLGQHAVLVETVRGIGYRFRDPAGVRE